MSTIAPTTEHVERDAAGQHGAPRRQLRSRLSAGHLVMFVAALVAMLLNYAVLRARDDTVRVAVAAEMVRPGEPVAAGAFDLTELRVTDDVLTTLLQPHQLDGVDGWVATTTLEPGELVRAGDLRPPSAPQAQRAMSIPIDPRHAVGGALRAGDRVDVIEVRHGVARYLVTGIEVLDVPGTASAGPLGGALQGFSITVAVDDEAALRLALAIREGQLEVVRSTGASEAASERYERTETEGVTEAGVDGLERTGDLGGGTSEPEQLGDGP